MDATYIPYIHEAPDWPRFRFDLALLAASLARVRHHQGRLIGQMQALGFAVREQATLEALTDDVQKSSQIEGESLDRKQVRSSIARRLGIPTDETVPVDRSVEGIVEITLDATQRYDVPLTKERLFGWHATLFPTGYSGMHRIRAGQWRDDRDGPMQVVSGPIDRRRVHYQAPASDCVPAQMDAFLAWFEKGNDPAPDDPVLRAALAHLWFVTIHPFEDGNGRIARVIADMALARAEQSAQRFYSLSAQIESERHDYYAILERTQKGGSLDVTAWMDWFLGCLDRALARAQSTVEAALAKKRFWDDLSQGSVLSLNERQRLLINRLLDGFEGKLTTSKWARIAKCSQDTAHRDILDLIEKGIVSKDPAGGRSTSYSLRRAP